MILHYNCQTYPKLTSNNIERIQSSSQQKYLKLIWPKQAEIKGRLQSSVGRDFDYLVSLIIDQFIIVI